MSVEINQKKATQTLFVILNEGLDKEQIRLPPEIGQAIAAVLDGAQKTYRYILFTGLLAKATNRNCHARSLQLRWPMQGAYDARSFCAKVVCPFEIECLDRKLGGSSDPLVNKPGRFESVELSNPTQGVAGTRILHAVYAVLEHVQCNPSDARPALAYAMAHLRTMRQPSALIVKRAPVEATNEEVRGLLAFLNANCGGEASVSVVGSIFRILFQKARVQIHHVNEAGSASRQYGDIDVVFPSGKVYAVEVKDKPFNGSDVDHAAAFALNRGAEKLIWATGPHGETSLVDQQSKVTAWSRKGIDLSFLNISGLARAVLAAFGRDEWADLRLSMLAALEEMNAKTTTRRLFAQLVPCAQNDA